jgi:hypothetical protein
MKRTDMTGTRQASGISNLGRKTCGLTFAIAIAFGVTGTASAAQFMTHHVRDAVSQSTAQQVGSLPATKLMAMWYCRFVTRRASINSWPTSTIR